MAQDDDGRPARKGTMSAFALLKSWLFDKSTPEPAHNETEFLNTRDGYELARFAEKAFGGDAEAKKAHQAAVEAEQAEIDALLQGTGAVPMPVSGSLTAPAAAAAAAAAAAPVVAAPPQATTPAPPAAPRAPARGPGVDALAALPPKTQVDMAVRYLEQLRNQGLSVETLAEALIVIESREVRKRSDSKKA
ncbi:MAG: hypothetical protein RJA10_4002 [Pseudomonadota bacterium]